MKLVLISDTHNQLSKIKLPKGDLLIHAGDWTMRGDIAEVAQFNYDLQMILEYQFPLGAVIVAGNHDYLPEKTPAMCKTILRSGRYLEDSGVEINGLKFWGSPATPWFLDWAFNFERGEEIKKSGTLFLTIRMF